ncbi:MAG: glycosyltransferase family 4 protein [bacterium]
MKKNICMIVYTDYTKDTRVRREAETLALLPEYDVTILALKSGVAPRNYSLDGVRVLEMNERKYRGKRTIKYLLSYARFFLLSFISCTWLIILGQIDIIHVHNMPNFLVFASIFPRLLGKYIILDIHDTVPETFLVKFNRPSPLLVKLLYFEESISCLFADRIICVNHVQSDALIKRGIPSDKITISMNVPDDKRFNPKNNKRPNRSKDETFKIVYHGTIAKRLGIDLIIRAVAFLSDKIDSLELNIWGDGDDQNEFIWLAKELNIQDRVYFKMPGFAIDQLPAKLGHMDVGIVGNRKNIATELMLPIKMLEYIALGIPVVVPKLKGIEYYFSDEMVCYFEPENVDSMASAILKLYKDESLRKMQAKKAKTFLNQYGWNKHKMELIRLYKTL